MSGSLSDSVRQRPTRAVKDGAGPAAAKRYTSQGGTGRLGKRA